MPSTSSRRAAAHGAPPQEVRDFLRDCARLLDEALDQVLPAASPGNARVAEAMRYAVLAPGKRIRPALLLAVADSYGTARSRALAAACAVEMVHACSLILDDLPCMDDSELRRGRSATHRVYGEATAILAAFGLLNQAFGVLATEGSLPDKMRSELSGHLAAALGTEGLIAGQALDLALTPEQCNLDELEGIHSRKTGSLFIACVEIGALLGRAPEAELEALRGFAKNLGLAYQIVDDLLDAAGDPTLSDKPLGKDRRGNFVTLSGVEGARRLAEDLYGCALEHLAPLGARAALLRSLAGSLIHRSR